MPLIISLYSSQIQLCRLWEGGFSGLVLKRIVWVAALIATVFIVWNVSISALSFAEDRGPCLSVKLCCVNNLLNDLPSISGRYPEKVTLLPTIYMSLAGQEVRIGKNFAVLKTSGTVFPNTDRPWPANNVFSLFFFLRSVRGVRMGKSGPLERVQLANQIQRFRIPNPSDDWENNNQ